MSPFSILYISFYSHYSNSSNYPHLFNTYYLNFLLTFTSRTSAYLNYIFAPTYLLLKIYLLLFTLYILSQLMLIDLLSRLIYFHVFLFLIFSSYCLISNFISLFSPNNLIIYITNRHYTI